MEARGVALVCNREVVWRRAWPTAEARERRRRRGGAYAAPPADAQLVAAFEAARGDANGGGGALSCGGGLALVYLEPRDAARGTALLLLPVRRGGSGGGASSGLLEGAALAMLEDVWELLRPCAPGYAAERLEEAAALLAVGCPFGAPVCCSAAVAAAALASCGESAAAASGQRRPAWRPAPLSSASASNRIELHVKETLEAVQVAGGGSALRLRGEVLVNAELGDVADVTLCLSAPIAMGSIAVHSCATPPDSLSSMRICFTPPAAPFVLCRYTVHQPPRKFVTCQLDVSAVGLHSVRLHATLVIDAAVAHLDFALLEVPLGQGPVASVRVESGNGTVEARGSAVRWQVGVSSWGARRGSEACVLEVVVVFDEPIGEVNRVLSTITYASNQLMSGLELLQLDVFPEPRSKPRTTVQNTMVATDELLSSRP